MRLLPLLSGPAIAMTMTLPMAGAYAQTPPAATTAAPKTVKVAPHAAKPAAPPEPAKPAPSIALALDATAPDAAWAMRIDNTGAVPLQVIADAHLLSFDITPPDAKKAVHCSLPLEMRRTADVEERALVIPPGRSYSEKLDPRIFCFSARAAAALVPGASVVAHLGWPISAKKKPSPPYEVRPIEGLEPQVAAAKEIVSPAATIGAVATTAKTPDGSRPLKVTSGAAIDVARPRDLALTVTIANQGTSSQTFLLRPETITLDINGPSGIGVTDPSPSVRCEAASMPSTGIRDVFTTLAPKGRTSLTVMVGVLCPEHTFDQAGLYVVRARLDTRRASGAGIGLRTFDGDVPGDNVTRVRVREDQADLGRGPRPKLDEPARAQVAPSASP